MKQAVVLEAIYQMPRGRTPAKATSSRAMALVRHGEEVEEAEDDLYVDRYRRDRLSRI